MHDLKPIGGGDRGRLNLNTPVYKLAKHNMEVRQLQDQIILGLQVKRQHLIQHLRDTLRKVKVNEFRRRANMRLRNRSGQERGIGLVDGRKSYGSVCYDGDDLATIQRAV
jgi:hypothetical protein